MRAGPGPRRAFCAVGWRPWLCGWTDDGLRLRLLLLSRVASRCGSRGRGEIARALVNRTRNAEPRIGAEPLDEFGGLGIRLELERLLGPFRDAIWGLALEVPCVDVRATVHEDLNHLVQTAERRSVERRVVGLVDGVDVGAGVEQRLDGFLGHLRAYPALQPG